MAIVRRVGPGSAFKVGLVLYALMGLVLGICVAFFSMVAGSLGGLGHTPVPGSGASWDARSFGLGMGLGAIIFLPLFYGLVGGVFAAISAAVYNLAAGWVGGLEVDIN
jgi:hypothetical protein